MARPKITLKSKKEQSLKRFHPWVFSGAIKKMSGNPVDGDVVDIYSNYDEWLGMAHYQVGSITAKVFSFENCEPNREFWTSRVASAWNLRKQMGLLSETNNVFRLIHAEGDQMPGLIADYYGGTLVLQTPSVGMHLMKDELVEIFREVLGDDLTAIYDKSEAIYPKEAENRPQNGYLWGEATEGGKIVLEYGHKFRIDWVTGQKTGFFIDQRENRELLKQYAAGKKILNTFCYSGGFSIFALAAGASEVHSLDSSAKALDLVTDNLAINDMGSNHTNIKADAVDHVRELGDDYDIIILDPPAFAKHQSARHKAVQGYKRLNANAIRQIKKGGLIFTFSCSQAVDKSLFNHTITAAAIAAGRSIRVLHQLHQPADHPVNIFHPEGEYLKGLVIQVD